MPQIAAAILRKKNKAGGITIPDIKVYLQEICLSRWWSLYHGKERPLGWKPWQIGCGYSVIECWYGIGSNCLHILSLMISKNPSSWTRLLGYKSQFFIQALWPRTKPLISLWFRIIIWIIIHFIIIIWKIEYLSHKVFMQGNWVNTWISPRINNSDWETLSTQ